IDPSAETSSPTPGTKSAPTSGSTPAARPRRTASESAPKSAPDSAAKSTASTYYAPLVPGPTTLTQKIISAHAVGGTDEEVALSVDQILLEDATGTMACLQFEQLDLDRVGVPLVVSYVDHNVLQFDNKNPEDHAYLRSFAARYGL